jgi:sortase A
MSDRALRRLIMLLFFLAAIFLFRAIYIPVKAVFAQMLLRTAWYESITTQKAVKPWSWLDSWPVARLQVPKKGIDQIVLHGEQGAVLAFAPGMHEASVGEKENGNILISAHRDTHFRYLKDLQPGEEIQLSYIDGYSTLYRVTTTSIININTDRIRQSQDKQRLLLITCYPFDAIQTGGPLRYVVMAEEIQHCHQIKTKQQVGACHV